MPPELPEASVYTGTEADELAPVPMLVLYACFGVLQCEGGEREKGRERERERKREGEREREGERVCVQNVYNCFCANPYVCLSVCLSFYLRVCVCVCVFVCL